MGLKCFEHKLKLSALVDSLMQICLLYMQHVSVKSPHFEIR